MAIVLGYSKQRLARHSLGVGLLGTGFRKLVCRIQFYPTPKESKAVVSRGLILSKETNERLEEIRLVMKEREEMVKAGQEILVLIGRFPYKTPAPDRTAIQKKLLEFTSHLSNIGGFCGGNWTRFMFDLESYLGLAMVSLNFNMGSAPFLTGFMNMAVGIQVDFTKRPFRLFGFDTKAFNARVKAKLVR